MAGALLSTRLVGGQRPHLEVDAAELKVVAGPDRGLRVPLSSRSIVIGSDVTCGVVLHDPTVSMRHAEIVLTPRGYVVRDLQSTNGLLAGAHVIERAPLVDGMRLRLGDSVLLVHSLGGRQKVTLAEPGSFHGLCARSLKMRALVATLKDLARSDLSILIEGETGVGKEVVANALHAEGSRARGPFVVFDCGAAQPQLAAAELFGHEAGAFTGADRARSGLFEEAEGGTLFLDEIGELPLALQPLLLGVLERKRSRRIGGSRDHTHDVRVVAATNRNLIEEARAGRFRVELLHRLSAGRVHVPPLRERPDDLQVLVDTFARAEGAVIPPEVLVALQSYEWPGNVRELKNAITRLAVRDELPDVHRASTVMAPLPPLPEARREANDAFERNYIEQALARAGGNLTRAADVAGVSLRVMQLIAQKHGIRTRRR